MSIKERLTAQAHGLENFFEKHGQWLFPVLLLVGGIAFSNRVAVVLGILCLLYFKIKRRKKD
jgi:hypothetical protein